MVVERWEPRQWALEFEEKHGLHDIAGHYKYPEGGWKPMQYRMWHTYDMGGDRDAMQEHIPEFAVQMGDPSLTLQEIEMGPDDLKRELYQFLEEKRFALLKEMYKELEALNPELKDFKFDRDNTQHLSDVVHGVITGFNLDDIAYYLSTERRIVNFIRHNPTIHIDAEAYVEEFDAFHEKVREHLGGRSAEMGWVPSEATLKKIWEQVKDREPLPDTTPPREEYKDPDTHLNEMTGMSMIEGSSVTRIY